MSESANTPTSIFPILLVNFIGILGYSVVIPILIFIVNDFGGNGFIYGLLGATYPFFQFIGAPILGRLSDRIGRKRVLVISQAGTFLSWVLFLIAFILPSFQLWTQDNPWTGSYLMTLPLAVIFLARILDGFTGGNISVANAYLSDISTEENRNSNFGKMGASSSLGFVIGPAFAGLLAATVWGEVLPLIIAALISLIAIFVIIIRLKESNPCIVDTGKVSMKNFRQAFQIEHKDCYTEGNLQHEKESHSGWRSVLRIQGIPLLYSIYFLTFLAFSLFYASLPIYASTSLNWTPFELGGFLAYFSFIMVIVQGPVLTRLSKKMTNVKLIFLGSILLSVGFSLLFSEEIFMLYVAATVMASGNGIMWASFLSILAAKGKQSQQGAIQGYGSSMGSIASMLGLALGGFLFQNLGTTIFLVGAGLFVIIVFLLIFERQQFQFDPVPATA